LAPGGWDENRQIDRFIGIQSAENKCADGNVQPDLSDKLIELIPRMRRFAAGLSGSTDSGDDLVQAACERLLLNQAKLRPDSRLDSWFYRVIRNLNIDAIRAQSARDRNMREVSHMAELHLATGSHVEQHADLDEVASAMQQLSEEHRSVLMLICVEGLSYKEAAEVLDIPMGTVTSRLVRARGALMKKLDDGHADGMLGAGR
jgi:RNA polymerase sigma-70 factor (ECF subfamily)